MKSVSINHILLNDYVPFQCKIKPKAKEKKNECRNQNACDSNWNHDTWFPRDGSSLELIVLSVLSITGMIALTAESLKQGDGHEM